MSGKKIFRCAIYARKSSEEGLEQDFNSLDAQREACSAFITSQASLGWKPTDRIFADGGYSGGSMERPGLKSLLREIETGRIDVVVVYKIDRLTRSLMDFARIIDLFDQKSVSFVSVTQQFNTTTSMGRLTLNVLLSFAQFEREVTAERIRDKIAASKKKGIWMGGLPPLGYDAKDRKLVVNDKEADTVRQIFNFYLKTGTVRHLKEHIDLLGLVSKQRTKRDGVTTGGRPFQRGHLYKLLSNPVYLGRISHKGKTWPGQHPPIIDPKIWDEVQAKLSDQAPRRHVANNHPSAGLLTGLVFDEAGDLLSPTFAVKVLPGKQDVDEQSITDARARAVRRYRYYISRRRKQALDDRKDGWRLPAGQLEDAVNLALLDILTDQARLADVLGFSSRDAESVRHAMIRLKDATTRLRSANAPDVRDVVRLLIERIDIAPGRMRVCLNANRLHEQADLKPACNLDNPVFDFPLTLKRRGIGTSIVIGERVNSPAHLDYTMIAHIARAHHWLDQLKQGKARSIRELALQNDTHPAEISRILPLAFLAPSIVEAILAGNQPEGLTARKLARCKPMPLDWAAQQLVLGMAG